MKNLFSKIFGSPKKENFNNLSVLAKAVSDVGLWTWWTTDFPDVLQLEFNRTMLYFEPKSLEDAPSNQIAFRFKNPLSVTILKSRDFKLAETWLEDFTADKLEPFSIDHEYFSFDEGEISKMIEIADTYETIFGKHIENFQPVPATITLGFWAGEVGVVISAEELNLITHQGAFSLTEITEKHQKWWQYWHEYWSKIETEDKLPYDALCEITIPASNFKMNQ